METHANMIMLEHHRRVLLLANHTVRSLRGGSWMDDETIERIRREKLGKNYNVLVHERKSPSPSQSAIDKEEMIHRVFPDMRGRGE